MPKANLYLVACGYCKKDHPFLGEDMIICSCGATTRIIQIDDGTGHTVTGFKTPEESRIAAQEASDYHHAADDTPAHLNG